MKKRIITLILLSTLTSSLLFGCGKEAEPTPEPLPIEEEAETEETVEEKAEEVVEEAEEEPGESSNKATANLHRKEYKEALEAEAEDTEFLVVDNDTKEDKKAEADKTDTVSTKTATTTSTTSTTSTTNTTNTTTAANTNTNPAPAQNTNDLPGVNDVVPVEIPETPAEQPEYVEVPSTPITTTPTSNVILPNSTLTDKDVREAKEADTDEMIRQALEDKETVNCSVTHYDDGDSISIW